MIIDLVPNHTLRATTRGSRRRWPRRPAAPERGPLPCSATARGRTARCRRTTGSRSSAAPAWTRVTEADGTPGQWYLHLFDASQPDLDWDNPRVRERVPRHPAVLARPRRRRLPRRRRPRHGQEAPACPTTPAGAGGSMGWRHPADARRPAGRPPPYCGTRTACTTIYRDWREDPRRVRRATACSCAEAWVEPLPKLARWVRPDEMHQAFNFAYLETPWDAGRARARDRPSLAAFAQVGAPSTWVLSNHDVVRHATRLGADRPTTAGPRDRAGVPQPGRGVGLRRARAATLLMLALPGSAYLYQGEELGLPEVIDLPDAARQDPTWFRSGGTALRPRRMPGAPPLGGGGPAYGFGPSPAQPGCPSPPTGRRSPGRPARRGPRPQLGAVSRGAGASAQSSPSGTGSLGGPLPTARRRLPQRLRHVVVILDARSRGRGTAGSAAISCSARDAFDGAVLPRDTAVWLRA